MDPLSDVLAGMHVNSFGYARLNLKEPWGISYAKHTASLGMIVDGDCWLGIDGVGGYKPLSGGDCFLIVNGHAHTLRSDISVPVKPFKEVRQDNNKATMHGGNGGMSSVVGGWFRFDPLSSLPLTKFLPPLIHISAADAQATTLQTTLKLLASETQTAGPGAQLVVNRLAEVLLIQMIRAYLSTESNRKTNWLSALSDHKIGAALSLLHTEVNRAWTVGSLAAAVRLSRSAFAHRFTILVGEPPMEYLTNWRMFKACSFIRSGDKTLSQIAQSLGYDSDAAFNRAFKRSVGITPGQYRIEQKEIASQEKGALN